MELLVGIGSYVALAFAAYQVGRARGFRECSKIHDEFRK